jgi:hypothetical protein
VGPSARLVRTLFQRVAPNPPNPDPGPGGFPWSAPVLPVARTKSAPELLSLIISLTTACLRSCSPMIRASIVLSAEDRRGEVRRGQYSRGQKLGWYTEKSTGKGK